MVKEVRIRTKEKEELFDITHYIQAAVREAGLSEGLVCVYVPHTSAAVSIHRKVNDAHQPKLDVMLKRINPDPETGEYTKAALLAPTELVLVKDGQLTMDEDQRIYFYEFDGPKERRICIYLSV